MTQSETLPNNTFTSLRFKGDIAPNVRQCFSDAFAKFPSLHQNEMLLQQLALPGYTMRAQPIIDSKIFSKSKRRYRIQMSNHLEIAKYIKLEELPNEVLIGWFAHELGHIVDYHQRSAASLVKFIAGYVSFPTHRIGAERRADLFALDRGFGPQLMATKLYILEKSSLPDLYKKRIQKYYMSPDELEAIILEKEPERVHF